MVGPFGGDDFERLDVETVVGEGFTEQGFGRHVFIAQKQNLGCHDDHYFGGGIGGASSGAISAPISRNSASAALE